MMRFWKRGSEQDNTRYLSLLDPGGTAVKAIVLEQIDGQATILGRGSAPHVGGLAPDGTIGDVDALSAACEQALRFAEDATEGAGQLKIVPDVSVFSVPMPWLRGAVGTDGVARTALEAGIDIEECYEPIARAGRRAMRNLGRVVVSGKWELVDAALVAFAVDGHRVTNPVDFRGHMLEATSFVLAAPQGLLDTLREIADRLQLDPPYLAAEPLALAAALPSAGLVVEMGALTTGLVLVRYGVPIACGSVPQGGSKLTEVLADAFGLSLPRAEALKRAYGAGQLGEEGEAIVRDLLQEPLRLWLAAIIDHLETWADVTPTWPPSIYLCGGASQLPDVRLAASGARWLHSLPFPRTPEIRVWDGSNLSPVLLERAATRWTTDGIVLSSLAAWTLRDQGPATPDGVLRTSLGMA